MQQKQWDAQNPSSRLPGLTLHICRERCSTTEACPDVVSLGVPLSTEVCCPSLCPDFVLSTKVCYRHFVQTMRLVLRHVVTLSRQRHVANYLCEWNARRLMEIHSYVQLAIEQRERLMGSKIQPFFLYIPANGGSPPLIWPYMNTTTIYL